MTEPSIAPASAEPQDFTGRVALVTGGASGIGAAVAELLARRGAEVVVADIDEKGAADVVARIRSSGGAAYPVRLDVSDPDAVQGALAAIGQRHGGLDLAVNNAGITGALAPTGDFDLDTWHRVMNINLNGMFYCLRYELPEMSRRPKGAIVNLTSILGVNGMAGSAAYSASKHAVIGLTKACALDYATRGIRVNAVAPGYVDTPLISQDEQLRAKLNAMHPIGRIAAPDELAEVIAFLLSDRASFVTGSVHLADGGYSAR